VVKTVVLQAFNVWQTRQSLSIRDQNGSQNCDGSGGFVTVGGESGNAGGPSERAAQIAGANSDATWQFLQRQLQISFAVIHDILEWAVLGTRCTPHRQRIAGPGWSCADRVPREGEARGAVEFEGFFVANPLATACVYRGSRRVRKPAFAARCACRRRRRSATMLARLAASALENALAANFPFPPVF